MTTDKSLHVLIVGGGLAGLSLAHGLKKNNISYTVVDRETTPRGRNWGITISWGHQYLKQLLPDDLYTNLQACQPDYSLDAAQSPKQSVLVRDGVTGGVLSEAPYPGVRRLQIQRTKRVWAEGLDVRYGKKLVDLEVLPEEEARDGRCVVARFEDGSFERASVVVGADGGASRVRRWLLGEELAKQEVLPYTFMNFPFTLPAEKARWLCNEMNPNVDVAPHPKGMYMGIFLLDKPDLDRPETWIFYILTTWPPQGKDDEENAENRLERLRSRMDGWADPYKKVVEWLPDDVVIGADQLRIWHPKPWDTHGGRLTLAGDAAHSVTFHRGQGGNLAIRDAAEFLAKILAVRDGEQSLEEAVGEYSDGVVERGKEVALSLESTRAFHDYEGFLNSPFVRMGIQPSAK